MISHRSFRRSAVATSIVALAALGIAGCAPGADEPAAPQGGDGPPIASLTVAIAGVPDMAQLAVIKWQQLLEEDGVDVELSQMEGSDVALRVVIAGQSDMYVGSFAPLVRAVQETGAPLKLVAVDSQATNYVFAATPDVDGIDDLEGRTVGINKTGDLTESVVRAGLGEAGVDADSLEFVQIGAGSARVAALLAGQVDMVPVSIDQAITLEKEGMQSLLVAADYLPDYLSTGLITSQDFIDGNEEAVQYVVDKFMEAERWAASDKEGYLELSRTIVPELEEEDRGPTYDKLVEIGMFAVDGGMRAEQLESFMTIARKTNALTDDAPEPDVWAEPKFVEDYLDRNGEFTG